MTTANASADGNGKNKKASVLARVLRPLGVVVGLALSFYFIRNAGIDRTFAIVRSAGVWLPLLVLLQMAMVLLELFAIRALVIDTEPQTPSPKRVAWTTWLRTSAIAYACGTFLPAGRAAGEALRAAALSKTIGASRAAGAGARLQACSLLGSATTCFLAATVIFIGSSSSPSPSSSSSDMKSVGHSLAGLLALNGLMCATLGGVVFVLARSTRLAAWLKRVLARVVREPAGADTPSTKASLKAYALCALGRLLQTTQYGVAILAVGGRFNVMSSMTSQGIQLLGSTVGDLLPGQLGAMEGSFNVFATMLGVSDAQAISLVWIMRGAMIGLALVGMLVASLLPVPRAANEESPSSR